MLKNYRPLVVRSNRKAWLLLVFLSAIWGSSFFLIKISLFDPDGNVRLLPDHLGALRIVVAAIALSPFFIKYFKKIQSRHWKFLIIAGFCGNGIPAFLFAYAQTQLDSAITGMLNSTVPLFAILIATVVFKFQLRWHHLLGVVIGIIGTVLIVFSRLQNVVITQNEILPFFGLLCATLCYAISLNVIKYKLNDLQPMTITSTSFMLTGIPCLFYLIGTGFITRLSVQPNIYEGIGAVVILALIGTALAVWVFNHLIQISTAVFASSVTYFIPVVATLLGLLSGETVTFFQLVGMGILISGVILINRK